MNRYVARGLVAAGFVLFTIAVCAAGFFAGILIWRVIFELWI